MTDFIIHILRDPGSLVAWGGYTGLALVIFLETGALAFFFPGDSLLFIAGLFAAKGELNILILNGLLSLMAVLGDSCSYWIGVKFGRGFLAKQRWINPKHLIRTSQFYEEHGGKAIVMARFVPFVRTFIPIVAGIANMPYQRFAWYNIIGAVGWVGSMTLTGYFLGIRFPFLTKHIEKVIILIVLLSIIPALFEFWRQTKSKPLDRP